MNDQVIPVGPAANAPVPGPAGSVGAGAGGEERGGELGCEVPGGGELGGGERGGAEVRVAGRRRSRQPYLHDLVSAVHAPAMALSGRDGQIRTGGAQGIYVNDVRVISEMVLTVAGAEPVALGHDVLGGGCCNYHALVLEDDSAGADPRFVLLRQRRLNPEGATETLTIKSYAPPVLNRRVELKLACDLAAIGLVKSGGRPEALAPAAEGGGLAWRLPGRYSVRLSADPPPDLVDGERGRLVWEVDLRRGEPVTLNLQLSLREEPPGAPSVAAPAGAGALHVPQIDAADHRLQRFVEVSLADLSGLLMAAPGHGNDLFLGAGAPWYLALFGRDSLWAARMLLPLGTDLAMGTLRTLARRQGRTVDVLTGEEPGKILHELRREEVHNARPLPPPPVAAGLPPVYYGTVDATPLWVCLLHDAWKWGAPTAEVEALLGPMERCLSWMGDYGCQPAGFLTYVDSSGRGLSNQGWKDSFDGVQFRDGRLAQAPLALCEVQGYAYEAAMGGAELLDAFGGRGADRWREFALGLAGRFRSAFWMEDAHGPYPAMALQSDGTPVDAVSSNMGHLPGTGLLDQSESELVAARLAGADLNSGFGLRTLAASSAGFNPVSYHCGSVWAHDTAIAISGLARSGGEEAQRAAAALVEGVLGAAEGFKFRVPELYGGHDSAGCSAPVPYPASCHPQAWSAAAAVAVVNALLGLLPDVPNGRVSLSPLFAVGGVRCVSGLRLGQSEVTVKLGSGGASQLLGAPTGLQVVSL